MADWHQRAKELHEKHGNKWGKIAEILTAEFGEEFKYERVRRYFRDNCPEIKEKPKKDIQDETELLTALKTGKTLDELAEVFGCSERIAAAAVDDLKDSGYQIKQVGALICLCKEVVPKDNHYSANWNGDNVIRFGVVSDTHLCSKWQQLTHLNTLYDVFVKEGITTAYHPGDIDEGVNMRRGHEYEVFKHGADEHIQYIIDNYPCREGITTQFITGNHDHSLIKCAGLDIGKLIAKERPDMIYLGQANAKIMLTPNCKLELNHPLDGSAYALSYTLQKTIDAMSGGEKPNILLNGHHHKAMYLMYRNIHAFECGTLQAQTPWMRGKRLPAHMGGWIIEVHVDKQGTITRCIGEFIPFYDAKQNDY